MFIRNLLILCAVFLYVNAMDYQDTVSIELEKDEQTKILVKYGNAQRLFKFRWTLYSNGGLVVFRSYDKIVAQNILRLRHKNQSFRVELKTRGASNYTVPYVLVKFNEYDAETEKVKFQVFLSDKNSEVNLEYLDKK